MLRTQQEADRLRQELDATTRALAAVTAKAQAEPIARARSQLLTAQEVESLLARAWVALAGASDTLTFGSSSTEGRRHARSLIALALALDASNPEAHNTIGLVLAEEGDLAGAIAEYRTALRLKPDDAEAHFNLGFALEATGQRAEAAREFRAYLRLAPKTPEHEPRIAKARAALLRLE